MIGRKDSDIAVPVHKNGDQKNDSGIDGAPDAVKEDVQEAGQGIGGDVSITDAGNLAAPVDGANDPAETDASVSTDLQSSTPSQDSRSCNDILNTFIVEWTASQDIDDPETKAQIEKDFRDVAAKYARKPVTGQHSKHSVAVHDLSQEAGTTGSSDAAEEPNAVLANDQNADTSTTGSTSPDVPDVPRDNEEPALEEPLAKRHMTNEADNERVEEGLSGRRSRPRHREPVGQRRQNGGWRAPHHVEEDLQVPSRKRPREEPESSRTTRAIANNNTPVGTRLRTRTAPTQPKRKCQRKAPKDEEEQPSTSTGNAQLPTASNGSVLPEAQARAASYNPDPASSGPHQPQEDRLPEEPPFMKEVRETFKTFKIWNVARQIDFCSRHSIPIEQLRAVLVELRKVHWTDLRNSGAVSDPADYFKKYGNDTFRSGPRPRVPRRKVPKVRRVPAKVPAVPAQAPAQGDGERMDQS